MSESFCWTARVVSPKGEARTCCFYRDMSRHERVVSRRMARLNGWKHDKWTLAFGPQLSIEQIIASKLRGGSK